MPVDLKHLIIEAVVAAKRNAAIFTFVNPCPHRPASHKALKVSYDVTAG